MEFSELGKHCSKDLCKQIDFLPFECKECHQIFCKDHFPLSAHPCSVDISKKGTMPQCPVCGQFVKVTAGQNADAIVNQHILQNCKSLVMESTTEAKQKEKKLKECGLKGCHNPDGYDTIVCSGCQKKFCLTHRLPDSHDCSHRTPATKHKGNSANSRLLEKLKDKTKPRPEKKTVTKHSASSAAVQRIRVGLKAVGDAKVKQEDRFYLEVEYPEVDPVGVALHVKPSSHWFDKNWTVGKIIDVICKHANIENRNHEQNSKKLIILSKRGGLELPYDIPLGLLDPTLVTGDTIVLAVQ